MSEPKKTELKQVKLKKPPKTQEQKEAKFKELARKRVNRILSLMKGVGNLSNTNNYFYTREQAVKIVGALKGAVADVEQHFTAPAPTKKPSFDL